MAKGIDRTFLHYGIRTNDLTAIDDLCSAHELDAEWVKEEILKIFHEKRVDEIELEDKTVEKIINKALQKIR